MTVRIKYNQCGTLRSTDTLIYPKRGGGEKRIPSGKWWINRNTPVGEPAELWEKMPYGGQRILDFNKLIAVERPLTTSPHHVILSN